MTADIEHEATYSYPPEAVWAALTTPAAMRSWLMDTDFEGPQVGHRFQFRDKPRKLVGWNGITECEVLEAIPNERLVIRFGDGKDGFAPTLVSWDLERAPGGTRVRFRHAGFTGVKGWMMRQGMNQGWGGIVRHAIPFVAAEMAQARMPPREKVKLVAKEGRRADAAKAKA